jgi:hypothetical protein
MRGRNFHTYNFDRILDDIRDCRDRGARALFIVDDNITLDVKRFAALCQAIVAAGLQEIEYAVQPPAASIAFGDALAPLMRQAGFAMFLDRDIRGRSRLLVGEEHETPKGSRPRRQRRLPPWRPAHDMSSAADRRQSWRHARRHRGQPRLQRRYIDWPYRHRAPSRAPTTADLRQPAVIVSKADGTTAVAMREGGAGREISSCWHDLDELRRWKPPQPAVTAATARR